jgi:hypothetical protein
MATGLIRSMSAVRISVHVSTDKPVATSSDSATTRSTSAVSNASTIRPTSSRSRGERGSGALTGALMRR